MARVLAVAVPGGAEAGQAGRGQRAQRAVQAAQAGRQAVLEAFRFLGKMLKHLRTIQDIS